MALPPNLTLPSMRKEVGLTSAPRTSLVADWRRERREDALRSFCDFLPHWWFVNRETGLPSRFVPETMWQGQRELAALYDAEPWVFALKAGKLGFTQLESAFDAYKALRFSNSRVHIFSMNQQASVDLLAYVKYGLDRLPDWFDVRVRQDLAGGEKTQSLKISIGLGQSDVRTIYSYAGGDNVSIDQTCLHAHVDELARMSHPDRTWGSIQSTVAPEEGSCHIVSRGQGESDFLSRDPGGLWPQAALRAGKLVGYFAPWSYRPDRDELWFERESATMTPQQMAWFAPADVDDAFAGDATQIFVPMEWWDSCMDPELRDNPLMPGDMTPLILGMDAAVTGDCFAIIAVSRHPHRQRDAAVRAVKIWKPAAFGGRIDFDYIERWLRVICVGGCEGFVDGRGLLQQHPVTAPDPACDACRDQRMQERFNVVQIAYDPHELESMAQRLRRDMVAWMFEFNQGEERLQSDKNLYDLIGGRRIAHNGDPTLREHIDNSKAKIPKDDDKKLRLIKKSPSRKIDGAVALSMAAQQCLYLNMPGT